GELGERGVRIGLAVATLLASLPLDEGGAQLGIAVGAVAIAIAVAPAIPPAIAVRPATPPPPPRPPRLPPPAGPAPPPPPVARPRARRRVGRAVLARRPPGRARFRLGRCCRGGSLRGGCRRNLAAGHGCLDPNGRPWRAALACATMRPALAAPFIAPTGPPHL